MTTFKTETAKDAKLEDRYKNAWVRSPIKHFMVFFVTACSDAYVHLSSSGVSSNSVWKLLILLLLLRSFDFRG